MRPDEITLERMEEDLWFVPEDPRHEVRVAMDCVEEAQKHKDFFSNRKRMQLKMAYALLKDVAND